MRTHDEWEPPRGDLWPILGVVVVILLAGLLVHSCNPAKARDLGQWDNIDPLVKAWFGQLMQPDTIGMGGGVSCCGESDAYWADEVHVRDGHVFAVITDDRDDGPLMRMHEDIGTEYEVPPQKIVGKEQRLGNPTGHTVIFLGTRQWISETQSKRWVLCYVQNGGV